MARFTLTIEAKGFDSEIVREYDKGATAVAAAKAAASHPSCLTATVRNSFEAPVFVTRYTEGE